MYKNVTYICVFWYSKICRFSMKKCWCHQNSRGVSRDSYIFWVFSNKVAALLKKRLPHVFSCEFCEIFNNTFFTEHLWTWDFWMIPGKQLLGFFWVFPPWVFLLQRKSFKLVLGLKQVSWIFFWGFYLVNCKESTPNFASNIKRIEVN